MAILRGLAAALAACEVAGRTGALPTLAAGGLASVLALPFFAPAMLGAFACQLLLRPVATELAATGALALLAAPALWHFVLAGEPWGPLLAACAALGGASIAVLTATAAAGDQDGPAPRKDTDAGEGSGDGGDRRASCSQHDPRGIHRASAIDALLPAAILPLFVVLANPMVYLTAALWPTTFDHRIHLADLAFGAPLPFVVGRFVDGVPGLRDLCLLVYVCLPLALMLVHAARARAGVRSGDALVAFVAVTVVGYAGYQVVPVAGPVYAFGAAFPSSPPDASSLDAARSLVFPIPRNCMPSLHSAWALLVWWNARPLVPLARAAAGAFLAVTLLATVGLGYHYVVDVVAAFPLTMAVQAWATRTLDAPLRRLAMAGGLATAAAWIALVTFATAAFAWTPLLPWGLATAVVAWSWWMEARVAATRVEDGAEAVPVQAGATDAARWQAPALATTMAVAGFAWALHWRVHTNIVAPLFATTAAARTGTTVTTLAVMAAGAAAAAMAVRRSSVAPLRAMAAALGAMATASLASATVLPSVELGAVDASLPVLPMAFLAGAAITFAAEAGGTTRPAATAVATTLAPGLGGAAALALVAAYFVLPNARAQHLPTALLVLATLGAAAVAARQRRGPGADASGADAAASADGLPIAPPAGPAHRGFKLAVAAGGLVGAAILAALSRLLVVAVGDTVFTEARLACTLAAGLAAGLVVATRVEARARRGTLDHPDGGTRVRGAAFDARAALAWTAAALASAIALGLPLWNALPAHFATYQGYIAHDGFLTLFPEREFVRLLAGLLMIGPAAACLGAAFAFAASLARDARRSDPRDASSSDDAPSSPAGAVPFGAALVGAGAGILAEALLAAPLLGAKATLLGGSACALAAAMVAATPAARGKRGSAGTTNVRGAIAASAVLVMASAAMVPLDYSVAASESGFTLRPSSHGVLVDALGHVGGLVTVHRAPAPREGAMGGVASGGDEALRLAVNGRRRDATDADLRVAASTAIGALPSAARRGRAVVAGLAAGRSVRALVDAGFADVIVAEPDAAVVELARRHFAEVHDEVLDRDGVRIVGLDGRSVLAESDGGLDIVVIENSDVATLEVAAMATREMHGLVAARLAPGGALLQRLALDRLSPVGLASVLASMRAAFAEVHVRHVGDEALAVACAAGCAGLASSSVARPASPDADEGLLRTADVDALVESLARHLGVAPGALAASDTDMAFQHNLPTGVALAGKGADDARALLARMADDRVRDTRDADGDDHRDGNDEAGDGNRGDNHRDEAADGGAR